ncbi:glutamate-5-semialdehyde dehydrogenase [Lysinibacillus sp. 2017]|uniref:glutamate-5-semialdehyde dehydrogenase n=1 Tax=unclassified Lysinibacillus TaxID=2636778 RepID=UPI000D528100|nr:MULTISPECIES: glutamate-5-semialdehyde dehydrogenase [unclassified Lysinibacillus]AWE09238.1 glutamate-5-semialdehyde dehydrogenase [Lysinibacillus sp. 2017]TGN37432.1 glutamate-5-semialdehyde dehydrogenase [Lysinibacillus sp. S2017]
MENEVIAKGKRAKIASYETNIKSTSEKNEALKQIAAQLLKDMELILVENAKDIVAGEKQQFPASTLDRILLTEDRVQAMSDAILQLIELPDPVGEVLEDITKENGLHIIKKRVPLGVIGMIYEARPNVTVDAATLCLKTGNAVLLRGSSSAKHSNIALVSSIHRALQVVHYPQDAVLLIEDTSRETAKTLFTLNEYLDVLIPRGGKNLIDLVVRESTVPVLETGAGNCHIYLDHFANVVMAKSVVKNAKTQRLSVCNTTESLLMHEDFFDIHGKEFLQYLSHDLGIKIYGDDLVCHVLKEAIPATDEHYAQEFLALTLSVKIVKNVFDAIHHINHFGTNHSEAIITENQQNADVFLNSVDAAAVYHNASTRFTDGFEFGYGAEIGISTQKLHARGPMGLPALTSTKYYILGNGQVRP